MIKSIVGLSLCFGSVLSATAATVKPFSVVNKSTQPMLAIVLPSNNLSIDETGTVFSALPLAKQQTWSSSVKIENTAGTLKIFVVEDDGRGNLAAFDLALAQQKVCQIDTPVYPDATALLSGATITPFDSPFNCALSSNGKQLIIESK